MKSFRLYKDSSRFHVHGFISFMTDPDESIANLVATSLRSQGLEITLIQGDTSCPYTFGSKEASKWIKKSLSTKVNESQVLISIASEHSLRSQWVFHEFFTATQNCKFILLLWFNGPSPANSFFPSPRPITKRLPSCPVFIVDCRSDLQERLKIVAEILNSLSKAKWRLYIRKAIAVLMIIATFVIQLQIAHYIWPAYDPINVNKTNNFMSVCSYLDAIIAVIAFPGSYRLLKKHSSLKFITCIVQGKGVARYIVMILFLLSSFGLFPLTDSMFLPALLALSAGFAFVIFTCVIRMLRLKFINRFYAILDAKFNH